MDEIVIYGREREINRRLSLMLEDEGYATTTFDSQDEVSDYLKKKLPSLVIFEFQPDCIKDLEHITFLNTIATSYSSPLLLIVSREQIPSFSTSAAGDHVAYLEKPILHSNLLKRVRDLLGRSG